MHIFGRSGRSLPERLDDLDELVDSVAVPAREPNEVARLVDHGALLWRPCDRDPSTAAEFEKPLLAQLA
jgi:hypothetical protein